MAKKKYEYTEHINRFRTFTLLQGVRHTISIYTSKTDLTVKKFEFKIVSKLKLDLLIIPRLTLLYFPILI